MTSADRSRSGRESSRNPRRSATRTLAGAAAVTLAGMIATPLVRRGGPARRALSSVVVTGLFTTTTAAASPLSVCVPALWRALAMATPDTRSQRTG